MATDAPTRPARDDEPYLPLNDTLRLYAGWLLAWYCLVYLLGSMQLRGQLPFAVPFIDRLFQSTPVLYFAFSTYLYLALGTVHKWLGGGIWKGLGLTIVGVGLFVWFFVNA